MITSTGGSRRSAGGGGGPEGGSGSLGAGAGAWPEERASRMNLRSGEVGALKAGGLEVGWYMCAGRTERQKK